MQILSQADLRSYHTFAISQTCRHLTEITSIDDLIDCYQNPEWQSLPKLMLGKGSNMLFTQSFDGVVMVNQLSGKKVVETESDWLLHIAAGEDWPNLVEWAVSHQYNGLENLALIPGCAGSAPIQNIGAYGVELKDVCEYADYLCLESFEVKRLSNAECKFGYRDSIFKHDLYQKAIVVAIGLKLSKSWQPNIEYGPLRTFDVNSVTSNEIFEQVCQVRKEKLPDPSKTGNAGSFFKNPIITQHHYEVLKSQFPDLVAYAVNDGINSSETNKGGMKVAAGWLIDQCGLKGHTIGGAQVHPNQALVIVNTGNAVAQDVVELANCVRSTVWERYEIALEHEVRFMGAKQETTLSRIMETR